MTPPHFTLGTQNFREELKDIFLIECSHIFELNLDETYPNIYDIVDEWDIIDILTQKKWYRVHEEQIYIPYDRLYIRNSLLIFKGDCYHFTPKSLKEHLKKIIRRKT